MKHEEIQIMDEIHLMYAEGKHEEKPDKSDIIKFLECKGYTALNIYILFDDFQKLWIWDCDISK